jgi:benzodiazapine receptor
MTLSARRRGKAALGAAAAACVVAALGALSTDLGPWYASLKQPDWKPPDWLFGPVWTVIFALAALAGLRAGLRAPDAASRRRIVLLFVLNGALNVLWSLLFFRAQRPDWALAEVGFLWASILLLMLVLGRHSRGAAVLLLPYLVWVAIAAWLNYAVVQLNGPFV